MYEQFFGFSRPLYVNAIAQDEDVFQSRATRKLTHDLDIALARQDSIAVITGASGVGKTTIAAESLRSISTRLAFACITQAPLTPQELLEQLLADYGLEPYNRSRAEQLQLWRQFLSEMAATETRVGVLVEDADRLAPPLLRCLHELTAADAALTPGANIVLTATSDRDHLFSDRDLLPLEQRVRLTMELPPLTATETEQYLAFKCEGVDVAPEAVFADDFPKRLHDLSGGIIRVLDNLIESSLRSAADHREQPVTAERLQQVARQFGMKPMSAGDVDRLLIDANQPAAAEPPTIDNIPTLIDYVADADLTEEREPSSNRDRIPLRSASN